MSYEQFAYYYDYLMADMPYDQWLSFVEQTAQQYGKPLTIVDLGCGTGTIACKLAEQGYHVYGVDLSADMLAVASERAASMPVSVTQRLTWLEQDMTQWHVPEKVQAVLSLCDSVNYLLEEEQLSELFKRVWEGLEPGGWFLFDMLDQKQYEAYEREQPFVWDDDLVSYLWTCEYDAQSREIEHQLVLFAQLEDQGAEDDECLYQRIRETHRQRAYPSTWVEQELRKNGFLDVRVTADFSWASPDDDGRRLFYVARKPLA